MADKRIYTHSWSGLLWYDLPLSIIIAFIFHYIVRDTLINNLPFILKCRLARYKNFVWKTHFKQYWLVILLSVIVGGSTHLLWDGFTHENSELVQRISFLRKTWNIAGLPVEGHMLLQVLSSITGGIVILYAIWQLPSAKEVKTKTVSNNYWILIAGITLAIYLLRLILSASVSTKIEDFIIPAISAFLLALILAPLCLKYGFNRLKM